MPRRIDIRALRTRMGVSQSSLANTLGVHVRTIIRWENDPSIDPSPLAMQNIRRTADEHDRTTTVAHLPGDDEGAKRLAPLASVLPSMGRS